MTEIELIAKINAEQDRAEKVEAQLLIPGLRDGQKKKLSRELKKVKDRIATLVRTKVG